MIGLRMAPAQEFTANAAMDRFVHALVEASREAGYHLLLFSAAPPSDLVRGYDDLLRSTAVDAFIVTDTYLGNPQAPWLSERRAPFVAFGRPWEDPEAAHPWVDVDGAAGGSWRRPPDRARARADRLGRLDQGSCIGEDRRAGWSARCAAGLSTDGLACRGDTVAVGREAARELLDTARPSAIVCASDTVAVGVLHTLAERGLRPGHDIAVVGFDDSQVAQVVPGGLTSVRQPLEEVAVELVRALEALLAAEPYDAAGVLLLPTLAVRGSSG